MNEIALRYASALFSLANENNHINDWQLEIKELKKIFENDEEFITLLGSSFLASEEKNEILNKTLKDVSPDIVSLLNVMVNNNRSRYIIQTFEVFGTLCNEYRGVNEGFIYSIEKLDEEFIHRIEEKISKIEKKKVELKSRIDPSLIGGIKVVIHDHLYDGSIRNQIAQMKINLIKKEVDQHEN